MTLGLAVEGLYALAMDQPIRLVNLLNVGARVDELTPAEVARECAVSPSTVRRWEQKGILAPTRRLPGSGYRRYSRDDVDAFKVRLARGDFDEQEER